MRKGSRFTAQKLARWKREGRGEGTRETYRPQHQVTRDDPASVGRSHYYPCPMLGRAFHLLSDMEQVVKIFATQIKERGRQTWDIREQHVLCKEPHPTIRAKYGNGNSGQLLPGTVEIARALNIRHPRVSDSDPAGASALWTMTTDLVVLTKHGDKVTPEVAISTKADPALSKRQKQLARIERRYWREDTIDWLLITPRQFDRRVGRAAFSLRTWLVLAPPVPDQQIDAAAALFDRSEVRLANALRLVAGELKVDCSAAQRIFWQSVWTGAIPLDLRQDLMRGQPLRMLPIEEFWLQNPVLSRRSAWED